MHAAGLPTPTVQVEVRSEVTGGLVARSDFGWEDQKTVGEFDGMVKYGRLLKPGQQPGDVVFKEKLREDRIRDEGFRVVRWTWHELDSGLAVARICRAPGPGLRVPPPPRNGAAHTPSRHQQPPEGDQAEHHDAAAEGDRGKTSSVVGTEEATDQ